MLVGESVQVRPVAGKMLVVNITVPVNPLAAVTPTVEVPVAPVLAVTVVGLEATVKSRKFTVMVVV